MFLKKMTRFSPLLIAGAILGSSSVASAAECWQVTGWSNPGLLAEASLQETDCTTTPEGYGWAKVEHGNDVPSGLFVRASLDDPRVNSQNEIQGILRFLGYDTTGVPVITTTIFPSVHADNQTRLLPTPPEQGIPNAGSRVRLRYRRYGNCLYSRDQNGADVRDEPCSFDTDQVYVLEDAGDGLYRLRHENSGQCLYALGGDGGTANNWGCWQDPNMRFALEATDGGYRLRDMTASQCLYGTGTNGGPVHHWVCWNDPNLVYQVDIVEYGGWTDWSNNFYTFDAGDLEFGWGWLCPGQTVVDIDCRTTGGVDWTLTGEDLRCDDALLACYDNQQEGVSEVLCVRPTG